MRRLPGHRAHGGPDGRVFVADTSNHRVQVLTKEGQHVRTLGVTGQWGNGSHQFHGPQALAMADGKLYVVDKKNERVHVFLMMEPRVAAAAALGAAAREREQMLAAGADAVQRVCTGIWKCGACRKTMAGALSQRFPHPQRPAWTGRSTSQTPSATQLANGLTRGCPCVFLHRRRLLSQHWWCGHCAGYHPPLAGGRRLVNELQQRFVGARGSGPP